MRVWGKLETFLWENIIINVQAQLSYSISKRLLIDIVHVQHVHCGIMHKISIIPLKDMEGFWELPQFVLFHFSCSMPLRVVVVGGGAAGLARYDACVCLVCARCAVCLYGE